jgi:type IV secretion system protein VirB5
METRTLASICVWICLLVAPAARAQFAVIDVGAITQLLAQVQLLENQLKTAQQHLSQAQQAFASTTGGRGMEQLLRGTARNYLPTNWAQLQAVMQSGGGQFGGLAGDVSATVSANAVLSEQALALLHPEVRKRVAEQRQLTALRQSLAREALQSASNRFQSLQQLIDVIPAAVDQKAVLDLQARIAAESAMLANEHIKLLTLSEVVKSQERAEQQQLQEEAILGHGQFATRFQPAP